MSIKTNYSEHVGLFTGQVNFPVNLVSRPGRNGLDLRFDMYYSTSVRNYAETWNAEAPTGVLGLGWLSPFLTNRLRKFLPNLSGLSVPAH